MSWQASRCQHPFSKPCLVNLISKDNNLVFSMSWQASRCQHSFSTPCLTNFISKFTHLVFSMPVPKQVHQKDSSDCQGPHTGDSVITYLAHLIRISDILPWDRKSSQASREGYIHWLYWNSRTWPSSDAIVMLKWRHRVISYLSVFMEFWKLILE